MREGRQRRLGLLTGTEGTVGDTYLDRILGDVDVAGEPNILSLDPDANVRTTDQRYLQDAYNYYLGGGFDASQPDFPIQADDFTGGEMIDTGAGDAAQIPGAIDTLVTAPDYTNVTTATEPPGGGDPDMFYDPYSDVTTAVAPPSILNPYNPQRRGTGPRRFKGGGIAKRGTGAAYKSGGRVKSMGNAKRGGGVAKR